ncbi:MAG TPA: hypothetical protein VLV18_02640 [Terriglobales bacterium]|nr:hypothetical protein [Terriglobales bacterium]
MNLYRIGIVCLFVNGFIFLFYAFFVPGLVSGVHGLVTLIALLFLIALPPIHRFLDQLNKTVARFTVLLLGVSMVMIVLSDILFALSTLSRISHDLVYALGNAIFVVCIFVIGGVTLKSPTFKLFGVLSLVTAIIALSTYAPQGRGWIFSFSLLMLGLWSFGLGVSIRRTK